MGGTRGHGYLTAESHRQLFKQADSWAPLWDSDPVDRTQRLESEYFISFPIPSDVQLSLEPTGQERESC